MDDTLDGGDAAVTGAALPGIGADLAAALAQAVAGIGELDLSQASRGALVEMAIAAERVKAWALQAKAPPIPRPGAARATTRQQRPAVLRPA